MKKRFSAIFAITVAAVLVSSIAYAAKKKLRTKSESSMAPDVSEADLAANLLDANGDQKHTSPKARDTNKHGDEELKNLTIANKVKK